MDLGRTRLFALLTKDHIAAAYFWTLMEDIRRELNNEQVREALQAYIDKLDSQWRSEMARRSSNRRKGIFAAVKQLWEEGFEEGLDQAPGEIWNQLKEYKEERPFRITVDRHDYEIWFFVDRLYEAENPPFGAATPCSFRTVRRYVSEIRAAGGQ